jgi:hypothetical protein
MHCAKTRFQGITDMMRGWQGTGAGQSMRTREEPSWREMGVGNPLKATTDDTDVVLNGRRYCPYQNGRNKLEGEVRVLGIIVYSNINLKINDGDGKIRIIIDSCETKLKPV